MTTNDETRHAQFPLPSCRVIRCRGLFLFSLFLSLSFFPWPAYSAEESSVRTVQGERQKVRLQLKWRHQFQFAGYYAAIRNGYYDEVGLEVELLEASPEREPAQVVLDGDADFGIATSDLLLYHANGAPVQVLAPIFQHSPLVFLVLADSGIESAHHLAGKTVMLEDHADELRAYLQAEGVDESTIRFRSHAFSPEALISGEVDAISAYSTDEPFLIRSAGEPYATLNPRSAGIDFYGDTLFTTDEMVERRPRLVERFLAASLQGWVYALDNMEVMAHYIHDELSQRHSIEHLLFEAQETRKLILPDVVAIGYNNPGRWRHTAEVYARLGMIGPDVSLDGFIYDPIANQDALPDWIVAYLIISVAILVIIIIVALRFQQLHHRLHRQAESLQRALDEVKVLRGIIPICAYCRQIRDDQGAWNQMERYISDHSEAQFSHGICEVCAEQLYGDYRQQIDNEQEPPAPSH